MLLLSVAWRDFNGKIVHSYWKAPYVEHPYQLFEWIFKLSNFILYF